jgi:hypothetical protein
MTTQRDIARKLGLDVSSVSKILNQKPHAVFKKETVTLVHDVARALGYDFGKLKHRHRRAEARKAMETPLELSIYLAGGRLLGRGNAVMRDVSLSGALLSGIVLPGNLGIPLAPHSVGIRLLEGPLKELEIRGKPVRFVQRGRAVELAVAFESSHDVARKLLRKIV